MTTKNNDVTLFSNGIGHFRRVYQIEHGKESSFSIPFKRDHIGDVAASLQVFGKVRLIKPPSFTPSNANATALKIDQSNAYRSLIKSLSGAQVTVGFNNNLSSVTKYTLLGLDTTSVVKDNKIVNEDNIVLMQNGIISRRSLEEVVKLHFEDEGVRTEIDKALKNNFQTIKPDSTLLDLCLSCTGKTSEQAVVQYTIPVAAWKMRYAIRQDGDNFSLEGAAIIDNNTDEDWDDFSVSVVTGNPVSFSTDIASVSVPQRRFIRLVDNTVLGNVEVEQGISESYNSRVNSASVKCQSLSYAAPASAATRSFGAKMSQANYAQFGTEGMGTEDEEVEELGATESDDYLAAESAGVESKEVGDFSIFTSKETITILARKSAVVPMFTVPLNKAGVVLLYKESNHARRPYRTIKFKNETDFSLGKGKTIIYNNGIFSGECVLDTAKPGENRMLPHCLENGVKVVKEQKRVETRRSSVRISEGVGITEEVHTSLTTYTIENKKDEKFKIAFEHNSVLDSGDPQSKTEFTGVVIKEKEKLSQPHGHRLYFELAPKETVTLVAKETLIVLQETTLGSHFNWLKQTIISVKNPLSNNEQIISAMKVQEEIDAIDNSVYEYQNQIDDLNQQVDRVRKNISAVGKSSNNTIFDEWIRELKASGDEIREIEKKKIPDLNKKKVKLQSKLTEEMKKISAVWQSADK